MKAFCLWTAVMLFAGHLFAQEEKEEQRLEVPRLAVKWSPLHLANTYATVQLDAEVRLAPRWTFQAGGSPVIQLGTNESGVRNPRGYKLKSELRYYFIPARPGNKKLFYVGLSLDHNRLKNDKLETFVFRCDDGDCFYRRMVEIEEQRTVFALAHRLGIQWYFQPWLLFDLNAGWGVRWVSFEEKGVLDDYDWRDDEDAFFSINNVEGSTPAVVLGVKFSVRIK